jgi:uncharacterized protein HemX
MIGMWLWLILYTIGLGAWLFLFRNEKISADTEHGDLQQEIEDVKATRLREKLEDVSQPTGEEIAAVRQKIRELELRQAATARAREKESQIDLQSTLGPLPERRTRWNMP